MNEGDKLRQDLSTATPTLWSELSTKAAVWVSSLLQQLNSDLRVYPKTFNDPIWGDIILYPWETLLLDSQLLQRLRGVRQLGMAHLVYPGAGYDRLEHCRGVVEAAERMIRSLERNACFRRDFGRDKDEYVPKVDEHDRQSIRLAALLHDIGHGAFSHTTEMLIQSRLIEEFKEAENILRSAFSGVTSIAPSEIIAVILIMSDPLRKVFESPNLQATNRPTELPLSICARILGSRAYLNTGYLSGVICGPIDADKLDYMARDSYHAGLPIGLDLHRLIDKLEVVTVTPLTTSNPEMIKRAENTPHRRYHEIGISMSGLGAYEQMIIGRVILYDRLYYHHKIRSAEAMVRRLVQLAEEEIGKAFTVQELLFDYDDDSVVHILGGHFTNPFVKSGGKCCAELATMIHNREIYYRAFAFAPRFIAGLDGLPDNDKKDARAILWNKVLGELSTWEGCNILANDIFKKASELTNKIKGLKLSEKELRPEHVIVDLPTNKTVVRGSDILTRTEDGHIATPNLFFDPERWSQAYEHQKQIGFVFTPRDFIPLVGLAARIIFFERYELVMDSAADRASKTVGKVDTNWLKQAAEYGSCSRECATAYQQDTIRMIPIRNSDLDAVIPPEIKRESPDIVKKLQKDFADAIPAGFPPPFHRCVLQAIGHLFPFIQSLTKVGDFVGLTSLKESALQAKLRSHLHARSADVIEGAELGGGETDLVLSNMLVIENKVIHVATASPLIDGPKFDWQARRYSIALSARVAFEMVAYKPKDETAVLPLSESISVISIPHGKSSFAVVRFVVPWGYVVPSSAKVP